MEKAKKWYKILQEVLIDALYKGECSYSIQPCQATGVCFDKPTLFFYNVH